MTQPEKDEFTGLEIVYLTQDELDRQTDILSELRQSQHEFLLRSGIAQRIVNSSGPTNLFVILGQLNEGSDVHLSKTLLSDLPRMSCGQFRLETGLPEGHFDATVYQLGRVDLLGSGVSSVATYIGGAALYDSEGKLQKAWPIHDLTQDDVMLMHNNLVELAEERTKHGLTMLDSAKLRPCHIRLID